jgi:lambda family phage portal protein
VNKLERAIAAVAPGWAASRARHRHILAAYEAAKPSRLQKQRRSTGSGDVSILGAARNLREQARYLEENHDLAAGALAVLVANVVGANGIGIEPQPRNRAGEIHDDLAAQILSLWRDWSRWPEVTWCHDWASTQRLLARSWLRDGEVLAQLVGGPMRTLDHGTTVPFSVEMIEADLLPLDLHRAGSPRITAGIERNDWGRPIRYHLYRQHPGDMQTLGTLLDLKQINAENVQHLRTVTRIGQTRGVSVFASVLSRLDDIKDYEESERVAAKVAASMAAAIKKGSPELYEPDANGIDGARELKFRPGMIFDDLLPGESIEMIDSKRPNPSLEGFRNGQLRAAASGLGTSYSSLSKDYNGTYSAQRQELVEQWGVYAVLQSEFTAQMVRPIYERFLLVAQASGALRAPGDVDPATLDDAMFVGPQMPWINPLHEAQSWAELELNGHASGPEIIRRRGQNPSDVMEQESRWRRQANEKGVRIATDPANIPAPAARVREVTPR